MSLSAEESDNATPDSRLTLNSASPITAGGYIAAEAVLVGKNHLALRNLE